MKFELKVYTDDSLKELKKVAEADELKIPYRVSLYVAQSLDGLNLNSKGLTALNLCLNTLSIFLILLSKIWIKWTRSLRLPLA